MLNDIFNALASGASQTGGQSQAGGDMLSSVLGSLAGAASPTAPAQPGGGGLLGMLGGLFGGQSSSAPQAAANPLMNMVSGGQNPMLNSLIQPVVDQISAKLGISPAIAMTVVTFAVHYMLTNHGSKLASGQDISGLLQQHTSQDYLHSTGMSKELAKQTGMKPAAAANALSEVFNLLGAAH